MHDYTLSFIGYPCYNVGCYNYNSIGPYYIVLHRPLDPVYRERWESYQKTRFQIDIMIILKGNNYLLSNHKGRFVDIESEIMNSHTNMDC